MLLHAKLHVPPLRPRLVHRARLTRRLTAALRHEVPLVLVSAPAGFGKTTFIGEWHRTRAGQRFRLAWLALDARDNDPARFWAYLVAALGEVLPGLSERVSPELEERGLLAQFEELAEALGFDAAPARPAVLVLDDYHLIINSALQAGLAGLIEHLPAGLGVIMLCREGPPLPLARWQARGQMATFGADDLRFSLPEAGRFLNHAMGLHFAPERVAAVAEQTEGWAAGLQLMALAAQGRPSVGAGAEAGVSVGQPGVVFDYLAQEVFAQQLPEVQIFLLHTAVLERMSPALVEALYDPAPPPGTGRAWLERLARAQLFVAPLDEAGAWYRYHPLMAEFLRARLAAEPSRAQAQTLHRRASDWYAANGDLGAAAEHALAAQDFERAAELLPDAIDHCLHVGHNQTALDWLRAMPEPLIRSHSRLCLLAAWTWLLNRQLAEAERYIEAAEAGAMGSPGDLALLRCEVAQQRGQLPEVVGLARQALRGLPDSAASLRALAAVDLGQAAFETGDWPGTLEALGQAERWASPSEHPAIYSRLAVLLAPLRVMQGQPDEAARLLLAGRQHLPAQGSLRLFQRFAHRVLAQIALERNDLAVAGEQSERCLSLSLGAHRALQAEALLLAAQVQLAAGHPSAARALLGQARAALPPNLEPGARGRLAAREARLWLRLGDLPAAEAAFRPAAASEPFYRVAHETFTLARLHLARHRCEAALELLARCRAAAEADGRRAHQAEALALTALAGQAAGEPAAGLAALEAALQLAEPAGLARLFIDEGAPMQALLQTVAARGQAGAGYAERLLRGLNVTFTMSPAAPVAPAPGALTGSELAVLRLMAAGRSNEQIAGDLTVSLNTVRSHAKHLFGKLDAHSRTQAAVRGRELGLLE
jgi:LuxR family maltose regulon positive regulatory protein